MAFQFLTDDDFTTKISEDIKDQITGSDDTVAETAETSAKAVIEDAFFNRFDMEAEFAETGADRHDNLIRWMLNLTVYFLYARIPDNQIPERVVKDYDDTMKEIALIEQGKRNTSLTKLIREDGDKETNFRWGSNEAREHDPFN